MVARLGMPSHRKGERVGHPQGNENLRKMEIRKHHGVEVVVQNNNNPYRYYSGIISASDKLRKSSRKIPTSELPVSAEVGGREKKKRARSKKVTKPQNRKKKPVSARKKKVELNLANIGSLGRTNAFIEATANSGRAAQPGFTETRKAGALQELLASVPEENRKVSRIDMKAIESASKIYGRGRVKADGHGAWLMKGTHNIERSSGETVLARRIRYPSLKTIRSYLNGLSLPHD
jgi:hypothetical protein